MLEQSKIKLKLSCKPRQLSIGITEANIVELTCIKKRKYHYGRKPCCIFPVDSYNIYIVIWEKAKGRVVAMNATDCWHFLNQVEVRKRKGKMKLQSTSWQQVPEKITRKASAWKLPRHWSWKWKVSGIENCLWKWYAAVGVRNIWNGKQ